MLSEGAIQEIISKPVEEHPHQPILQILGIKQIQSKGSDAAMLATQLNEMVTSEQLEVKAVIQLNKYICNVIQETRKVLILMDVTVIKPGREVPGKIGDPKNLNADPGIDRQNPPQKNGNGAPQSIPGGVKAVMTNGKLAGGTSRGAELASSTYGSHKPLASRGNNIRSVFPITSLTPYQNRWTIRVRVTSKPKVRTYNNSRGEGRVFNVDLVDESGEIRATGFNEAVDKFYDLLELDKVFYISKCSLRTANKKFTTIKNDYELFLNNDSLIEPCDDTCDLPTMQYNFVDIGDLGNFNADALVGIVINADDVTQITTKTTNRQVSKRDITLLDRSEKSVRATLWGEEAETFDEFVGKFPVLALKGAKVSDFGGRSLSILGSTNMRINPMDLQEAHSLRGWYDNVGKDSNVESLSGLRSDGGGCGYKTFFQMDHENLGMGDKADYFTSKATVLYMKKDNCLYKACPTAECNKKVIDEGDGNYRCEKCNKTYPNFKYRLMLLTNLADFTGNHWVTCFQETAELLLKITADELGQMRDSGDECSFDQIFQEANFKTYIFKIRAKMETYNDETRVKCTAAGVSPLDIMQEGKRMIAEIQKLRML
ncbi:hypothetical protein pdam_00021595 [Pocillopora damicornis]|uniref:Replication protein A subunit n=1 Tax=Pocillopora damicornis TaxID=46731 RepID=A0A3M6U4M4_POCDA|nr:hypothetical protein pdam_00021595 [Pocillopora damicornis]